MLASVPRSWAHHGREQIELSRLGPMLHCVCDWGLRREANRYAISFQVRVQNSNTQTKTPTIDHSLVMSHRYFVRHHSRPRKYIGPEMDLGR